jgi:hypothetical protein
MKARSRFATALLALICLLCNSVVAQEASLEELAVVDAAPGNITVAQDGTVIMTVHPSMPSQYLALAIRDGVATPFPNAELASRANIDNGGMRPVLGIRADREDRVWMLSTGGAQHLYAWDLRGERMAHDFTFENTATPGGGFNDIALALSHGTVFLSANSGSDIGIVALDIATGNTKLRLRNHSSFQPEDITAYIHGKALGNNNANGEFQPMRGGFNPITIDAQEEWVYYGAMSSKWVYRVRVADLLDDTLTEAELATRVEQYAEKTVCAGITIDDAGNVYVTDIQAEGIGVATPGQPYRLLVSDPQRLSWTDGISVGPDGYVYTGANLLFRSFASHRDEGPSQAPYYVTRIKAQASTTVGR